MLSNEFWSSVWPVNSHHSHRGGGRTDRSLCARLLVLHRLEKPFMVQLCFSSGLLPWNHWRCLQRYGRAHGGGAEDAYAPLALSTFPQRLRDGVRQQQQQKNPNPTPPNLVSLSLMEDCRDLIKVTDLQTLKDKGLLLGTSNDSYVGMGQVPVERIATATAVFPLKNFQKPCKKNNRNIFFGREREK